MGCFCPFLTTHMFQCSQKNYFLQPTKHPQGDSPLLASIEATGVWGFAGSFMVFCAGSGLESWAGSGKAGSVAEGGASSAATDAASLAMERVVILPLRRPWLFAVFLPRGVFCSFPSSSSPTSHLSLSLPMSLRFWRGKTQFQRLFVQQIFTGISF